MNQGAVRALELDTIEFRWGNIVETVVQRISTTSFEND